MGLFANQLQYIYIYISLCVYNIYIYILYIIYINIYYIYIYIIYIYLCSGYLRFVTCCRKILAAMFLPLMADLSDLLHQDRQLDTFETRVAAFDFPAQVLRAKGLGTPTAAVNGRAACCERSCTMQKHDISETTVLTILRF